MPTEGNESFDRKVGGQEPAPGPGYEMTDVNVNGVAVFLGGLGIFLAIFFLFCFLMGKVINTQFAKSDGPKDKWHSFDAFAGAAANNGKRQDLESNAVMQQHELQQMTTSFPSPRLDIDDGNQATADLHAREDLLLGHYSSSPDQPGQIRVPIERAMELIAERGLPVNAAAGPPATLMAGDAKPAVQVPLTTGFARTGYELDVIEARKQKMSFSEAEGAKHAELAPIK